MDATAGEKTLVPDLAMVNISRIVAPLLARYSMLMTWG
jgi:hypothetical protein